MKAIIRNKHLFIGLLARVDLRKHGIRKYEVGMESPPFQPWSMPPTSSGHPP